MSYYIIGTPGQSPRVLIETSNPALQCLEGEIFLEVPKVGQYLISEDGLSATAVPQSDELTWTKIRCVRTAKLSHCDWTQLPDIPQETREKWQVYRQALRDITNQSLPVVWPTEPQ